MLSQLGFVAPRVSCVVEADIKEVWKAVREWGQQPWLRQLDGQPVSIRMVEGGAGSVGSVRAIRMGRSQMFERLVALDDDSHTLKWRLISHPESVSPFGEASWVNFFAAVTLKDITHGNHTFVEWKGEFFTERHFATEMHATLERWFQSGLLSLKAFVALQRRDPALSAIGGLNAFQPLQPSMPFQNAGLQPGLGIPASSVQSYPTGGRMPVGSMPVQHGVPAQAPGNPLMGMPGQGFAGLGAVPQASQPPPSFHQWATETWNRGLG